MGMNVRKLWEREAATTISPLFFLFFFASLSLSLSLRPVAVSAAQRPTRRTFFLASRFSLKKKKKANNLGAPHSPRQGKMQHRNFFFARLPHRSPLNGRPKKSANIRRSAADVLQRSAGRFEALKRTKMNFFLKRKKNGEEDQRRSSQGEPVSLSFLQLVAI